jgi:hypothetical protein
MKIIETVYGNLEQAQHLIIGKDTVYVHTNITPITVDPEGNETSNLYQYHEVQYTKDEYIAFMANKNQQLEEELTDIQLALVELYENTIGV